MVLMLDSRTYVGLTLFRTVELENQKIKTKIYMWEMQWSTHLSLDYFSSFVVQWNPTLRPPCLYDHLVITTRILLPNFGHINGVLLYCYIKNEVFTTSRSNCILVVYPRRTSRETQKKNAKLYRLACGPKHIGNSPLHHISFEITRIAKS